MGRDAIKRDATRVQWLTVHDASEAGEHLLHLHLQSDPADPRGYTFELNNDMAQFLIYTLAGELRTHLTRTRFQCDILSESPRFEELPKNLTPSGNL